MLAIDPGHGMANSKAGVFDPGAIAVGHREADITLDWGLAVNWVCTQRGLKAWMTRKSDTESAPLSRRVQRAHDQGCTHFLSIHLNSGSVLATGTETLYRDSVDRKFAEIVHSCALHAIGRKDRGVKNEAVSPHGRLAVFGFNGPCCLVETAFITNSGDRNVVLMRDRRLAFAEMLVTRLLAL